MEHKTLDYHENYEIRAGLLIPTADTHPRPNVTLRVERGIITAITPSGQGNPLAGNTFKQLDFSRYTVLPGLVDCHVHLALDGIDFRQALARWEHKEELEHHLSKSLQTTLEHGVLAVRDGGDTRGIALSLRRNTISTSTPVPHIIATGWALRRDGMYGSFLGPGCTGKDIEAAVDALAAAGADQIKVLMSGVVSFKAYGKVGPVQFDLHTLTALVQHAHELGLKVMTHASSAEAVTIALKAGVDSLEHGYFLDHAAFELMAAKGIAWIPTLAPVANQLKLCPPEFRDVIRRTCHRQLEMVAAAAVAGVELALGTDGGATGVRHGSGFLDEVNLFQAAGLSPARILRAATTIGAQILGLGESLGRLKEGMPPNLIAVEGNPLEDLTALGRVRNVVLVRQGYLQILPC